MKIEEIAGMKHLAWSTRFGITLVAAACATQAVAIEPYQEYRKHIESAQNLTALKDDLMGDSVSPYNGQTEFAVTDISLPGNSALAVQLRRRFSIELDLVGDTTFNANIDGVGGWEIDVPHISGTFPTSGWADDRCSGHMVPSYPSAFQLTEIWQGNKVHIPGQGDRAMLGLNADSPRPDDGIARKWTTMQRDAIDCIPMQAGLSGEGYRLKTTEGVAYYFDIATSRLAGTLDRSMGEGGRARVGRVRRYLQASKVEDRFGNWVQYAYNAEGRPTRIWSSDGREITLVYEGEHLATATANGRSWSYAYGAVEGKTRLTSVTQPDGSAWTYGYSSALVSETPVWDGNSRPDCAEQPVEAFGALTMVVGHPSGASGTFNFRNMRHGRSGVHRSTCLQRVSNADASTGVYYYILSTPNFFDVVSLTDKTISGPGLPTPLTWSYSYGNGFEPLWGSAGSPAVYPCTTCKQEKSVTVANPDGTSTVHRYGSQYALNEGRLLGTSTVDATGNVVSTRSSVYMSAAEVAVQPFASAYGLIYGSDDPSTAQVRPVVAEAIDQDGVSYQTSMLSFDGYARPIRVNRSSALGSRTDATTYQDNSALWVLGQPATQVNEDTGLVPSETRYDELMRPVEELAFGVLKQSLSYNADGTVATVADGLGHVTALHDWKRGMPQSITFADGVSQSAVVDDNGWIGSITDENGSATVYAYDAMGRIASIDWPAGDSVAWARTTQSFSQIGTDEHGIGPGHWRQDVVMGGLRKHVYFDAFWRPVLTEEYDNAWRPETQRFQRFAYDEAGRQVFSSYPGSSTALTAGTWTTHDALGRVRAVSVDAESGLLTTLTEYLGGGQIRQTDPRGNVTTTQFQAFGEPSTESPVAISHPEGTITEINRDIFSKPVAIVRRNLDGSVRVGRSYVYDSGQRLCKSVEPETGATLLASDAADNLIWSAAGMDLADATTCSLDSAAADVRKVSRGYDARNRLVSLRFPDANGNQDWTYTPDGKPATVTTLNEAGATQALNTYTYNKRGLLTAETSSDSTLGIQSLGYAYDPLGAVAGLTYPSGRYVDYAPNALGQATKAGDFATGVLYHPNGAIKQFTYGNGLVHGMEQNARQLPARTSDSGGALDTSYEYDPNSNVGRIVDHLDESRTRAMTYDGLDRLVEAASPSFGGDGLFRYSYDAVDNLRSANLAGIKDHVYWYDANNRLANVQDSGGATTIALTYDVQGNVAMRSGLGYSFDFGNRLRAVAQAEQYRYDAQGRRILSTAADGGTIRSLYGNDGILRRQDNARTGKNTEYIHLNGSLVARVSQVVAPVMPVLSAPTFSNDGAYALSWTAVPLATRYELREQSDELAWTTVYDGPELGWSASAKEEGTFSYSVRACQASACSSWSATASVSVQKPPAGGVAVSLAPVSLNGTYVVSWNSVPGAATYRLEEDAGGGAWSVVADAAANSFTAAGKAAGIYSYRVQACNPAGCGPVSSPASTTVVYPPAGIVGVSVTGESLGGAYTVEWSPLADATRYELEESANGAAWAAVATLASTNQAFSGKASGSYAYRVRAGNDAGWGAYSEAATVAVIQPPVAPELSAPAGSADGTAVVSWTPVAMAVNYVLEESVEGAAWAAIQNDGSTQAYRSGLGFATYSYRVQACNAAGCSGYSNVASVASNPPPTTPTITSSVQYVWLANGARKIRCEASWTPVTGATSYEFQAYGGSTEYVGPLTSIKAEGSAYCAINHIIRACNANGCSAWSDPPKDQPVVDLGDLTNPW
ncbi:RHS repeat protein [Stenotrophomonas sp. CFBP 13725]|uniref:RHS repeat protein n=1 Tax=Stenotrophomonas sp. CFBP 13725 TaxID=2775297 RepID=UPI002016BB6D|nr:RHS repeat protein [Stenotrophomonas sp. CFBP 13725]